MGKRSTNNSIGWGSVYADSPSGDTALKTSGFANAYSVDFDGVNDYMEVAPYASLDGATSFSFSFWIYPVEDTFTRYALLLDSTTTPIKFIYRGNSKQMDMSITTTGFFARTSNGSVPLNQWTHVVWTFDGSQGNRYDKYQVYINGQLNSFADAGSLETAVGNFTSLDLGMWVAASSAYEGGFDEFAIYKNTILTQADADTIYNSGVPNDLNNNGLTAPTNWWRFEEGSGTSVADSGSAGDNGTLINGTTFSTNVPT